MKKWITCFFTVCLLAVALSVTAFAAGTVTSAEATGSSGAEVKKNETSAEKVDVTYKSAATGKEYLVLATSEEVTPDSLTDKNIVYIDQKTAEGTSVSFTVYPKELKTQTYYVYMSSNATSGIQALTQVGTYTAEGPAYTLGDVNANGSVDTTDAVWVLQNYVGSRQLDDTQKLAADVNVDKTINTTDAVWILQRYVGSRDQDFKPVAR